MIWSPVLLFFFSTLPQPDSTPSFLTAAITTGRTRYGLPGQLPGIQTVCDWTADLLRDLNPDPDADPELSDLGGALSDTEGHLSPTSL